MPVRESAAIDLAIQALTYTRKISAQDFEQCIKTIGDALTQSMPNEPRGFSNATFFQNPKCYLSLALKLFVKFFDLDTVRSLDDLTATCSRLLEIYARHGLMCISDFELILSGLFEVIFDVNLYTAKPVFPLKLTTPSIFSQILPLENFPCFLTLRNYSMLQSLLDIVHHFIWFICGTLHLSLSPFSILKIHGILRFALHTKRLTSISCSLLRLALSRQCPLIDANFLQDFVIVSLSQPRVTSDFMDSLALTVAAIAKAPSIPKKYLSKKFLDFLAQRDLRNLQNPALPNFLTVIYPHVAMDEEKSREIMLTLFRHVRSVYFANALASFEEDVQDLLQEACASRKDIPTWFSKAVASLQENDEALSTVIFDEIHLSLTRQMHHVDIAQLILLKKDYFPFLRPFLDWNLNRSDVMSMQYSLILALKNHAVCTDINFVDLCRRFPVLPWEILVVAWSIDLLNEADVSCLLEKVSRDKWPGVFYWMIMSHLGALSIQWAIDVNNIPHARFSLGTTEELLLNSSLSLKLVKNYFSLFSQNFLPYDEAYDFQQRSLFAIILRSRPVQELSSILSKLPFYSLSIYRDYVFVYLQKIKFVKTDSNIESKALQAANDLSKLVSPTIWFVDFVSDMAVESAMSMIIPYLFLLLDLVDSESVDVSSYVRSTLLDLPNRFSCSSEYFWNLFLIDLLDVVSLQFLCRPKLLEIMILLYNFSSRQDFLVQNIGNIFAVFSVDGSLDQFLELCLFADIRPDEVAVDSLDDAIAFILMCTSKDASQKHADIQKVLDFVCALTDSSAVSLSDYLSRGSTAIATKAFYLLLRNPTAGNLSLFLDIIFLIEPTEKREKRLKSQRFHSSFVATNFLGFISIFTIKVQNCRHLSGLAPYISQNILSTLFYFLNTFDMTEFLGLHVNTMWNLLYLICEFGISSLSKCKSSILLADVVEVWLLILTLVKSEFIPDRVILESFYCFTVAVIPTEDVIKAYSKNYSCLNFLDENYSLTLQDVDFLMEVCSCATSPEFAIWVLKCLRDRLSIGALQDLGIDSKRAQDLQQQVSGIAGKFSLSEAALSDIADFSAKLCIFIDYSTEGNAALSTCNYLSYSFTKNLLTTHSAFLKFIASVIQDYFLPIYRSVQGNNDQNFYAFCIQELFKIYLYVESTPALEFQSKITGRLDGIGNPPFKEGNEKMDEADLWRNLSIIDAALLTPLKSSKYRLSDGLVDLVFQSSVSLLTFNDSMTSNTWIASILKKLGSCIRDDLTRKLFAICFGPLRHPLIFSPPSFDFLLMLFQTLLSNLVLEKLFLEVIFDDLVAELISVLDFLTKFDVTPENEKLCKVAILLSNFLLSTEKFKSTLTLATNIKSFPFQFLFNLGKSSYLYGFFHECCFWLELCQKHLSRQSGKCMKYNSYEEQVYLLLQKSLKSLKNSDDVAGTYVNLHRSYQGLANEQMALALAAKKDYQRAIAVYESLLVTTSVGMLVPKIINLDVEATSVLRSIIDIYDDCYDFSGCVEFLQRNGLTRVCSDKMEECCWKLGLWDLPSSGNSDNSLANLDKNVYAEDVNAAVRKFLENPSSEGLPSLMPFAHKSPNVLPLIGLGSLILHSPHDWETFLTNVGLSKCSLACLMFVKKLCSSNSVNQRLAINREILSRYNSKLFVFSSQLCSLLLETQNILHSLLVGETDSSLLREILMTKVEQGSIYSSQQKFMEGIEDLEEFLGPLDHKISSCTSLQLSKGSSETEEEICKVLDLRSRLYMRLASLKMESRSATTFEIFRCFQEAIRDHLNLEEVYYRMSKFQLDEILSLKQASSSANSNLTDFENELLLQIGKNMARTVIFGDKYTHFVLPKFLTLWFDAGQKDISGESQFFGKLHRIAQKLFEKCSARKLAICLSSIISRICQPNPLVSHQVQLLLSALLEAFPQRTMWLLVAMGKSTISGRAKKFHEIMKKYKNTNKKANSMFGEIISLAEHLLALSNYSTQSNANNITTLSVSRDFRSLKRLFPLVLAVPTSVLLDISFSAEELENTSMLPVIHSIDDTIHIMPSLQRPKKISFLGSDGKLYHYLCKPKDDLRKDARFMEFASLANRLFSGHSDAAQHDLRAVTYSVIPLNEECGLVEWVDHTVAYRSILLSLYEKHNIVTSNRKLREIISLSLPPKEIYIKHLLPRYPAVFYEWFINNFSNPTEWYGVRLSYVRSCAVFSILGYIIGLGDRHGENLLLSLVTGSCVHVDFNCLFEKGLTFEKPEKVPFRLTHNMVDAMGPSGYHGSFLATAVLGLKILRENRDLIYNTLETFVHDPLVEWNAPHKHSKKTVPPLGSSAAVPIENEEARRILGRIDMKLRGNFHLDPAANYYLSEDAQIKGLIQSATSIDNLSEMYVGWAPFM